MSSNKDLSVMNQTVWSTHYLTDHLIMSALLAAIGAALGWVVGSGIVVYHYADVLHVAALHAAGVWAWHALVTASPVIPTNPAGWGYVPIMLSGVLMSAGGVLGWVMENRPEETHRRGYQVSDGDAAGIAAALRGAGERADGIALHQDAQMSQAQECRHIMILGGAGSGKTTILRPVISQAIGRGDRVMIFDFKADFTATIPGASILAPWDSRSAAWVLGRDIRTRLDAEALAATLVPAPERGDQIWAHGARGLLVALISQIQRKYRTGWGFGALAKTVAAALADYQYLLQIVTQESPQAKAFLAGADSRMTASFLAEMSAALSQVISLGVAEDAMPQDTGRWSVHDWLADGAPRVAILGYLPSAPDLSRAWCSSVIDRSARVLSDLPDCSPQERRVWLFLDEVPQAGRVPAITDAIVTLRSKGVRVVVGAQSIAQIRETYGRETATVWASSTSTKIIAQTTAPDDQRWASDLLGEREIERYQRQVSRSSRAGDASQIMESWQPTREKVMMPSDFGRLLHVTSHGPRALVIAGGEAAILRWVWPRVSRTGEARVSAGWLEADYRRPVWGRVPPEIAGDDADALARAHPNQQRPQTSEPSERASASIDPAARAKQAALAIDKKARNQAEKSADAVRDSVTDRAVAAAIDALIPGLGTALDIIGTGSDVAAPRPSPAAGFPRAPIDNGPSEQEDENER